MTAKLRRLETTLMTLGLAVIAFGVWNVAKIIIRFVMDYADPSTVAPDVDVAAARALIVIVFSVATVIVLIDAALRFAIGHGARKEGRGKNVGVGYLVLSVLAASASVVMLVFDITSAPQDANQFIDLVAEVIIDVTSISSLLALIVTSVKLKKLKKQIKEKEGS